jgi:1,4-dihydroxy-2-naphthoyl-CoA synthase
VTEWQPSGPEPGKDGPGNLSRAAQIAINRPEVRNASRPRPNTSGAPVIILTAPGDKTSCPDGAQKISREDSHVPGFAPFPGRP